MKVKCRKIGVQNWWIHEMPVSWFSPSESFRWARYRQRKLLGHKPVNYEYKLVNQKP